MPPNGSKIGSGARSAFRAVGNAWARRPTVGNRTTAAIRLDIANIMKQVAEGKVSTEEIANPGGPLEQAIQLLAEATEKNKTKKAGELPSAKHQILLSDTKGLVRMLHGILGEGATNARSHSPTTTSPPGSPAAALQTPSSSVGASTTMRDDPIDTRNVAVRTRARWRGQPSSPGKPSGRIGARLHRRAREAVREARR